MGNRRYGMRTAAPPTVRTEIHRNKGVRRDAPLLLTLPYCSFRPDGPGPSPTAYVLPVRGCATCRGTMHHAPTVICGPEHYTLYSCRACTPRSLHRRAVAHRAIGPGHGVGGELSAATEFYGRGATLAVAADPVASRYRRSPAPCLVDVENPTLQ
jgi:hypothetical protein